MVLIKEEEAHPSSPDVSSLAPLSFLELEATSSSSPEDLSSTEDNILSSSTGEFFLRR